MRTQAVTEQQRGAAYAKKVCDCGHPLYIHRELDREAPGYKPLHFHCSDDGCDCVRVVE